METLSVGPPYVALELPNFRRPLCKNVTGLSPALAYKYTILGLARPPHISSRQLNLRRAYTVRKLTPLGLVNRRKTLLPTFLPNFRAERTF